MSPCRSAARPPRKGSPSACRRSPTPRSSCASGWRDQRVRPDPTGCGRRRRHLRPDRGHVPLRQPGSARPGATRGGRLARGGRRPVRGLRGGAAGGHPADRPLGGPGRAAGADAGRAARAGRGHRAVQRDGRARRTRRPAPADRRPGRPGSGRRGDVDRGPGADRGDPSARAARAGARAGVERLWDRRAARPAGHRGAHRPVRPARAVPADRGV